MKAGVLEQLEVEQARAVLAKHGHSHLFAAGVAAGVVAERERAEAEAEATAGTGAIETGKVSSSSPHARRSKTSSERLLLFGPEEGSDNASDEASDDDDDDKDEQDQGQGQPAGKKKKKREQKQDDKESVKSGGSKWSIYRSKKTGSYPCLVGNCNKVFDTAQKRCEHKNHIHNNPEGKKKKK